MQKGVSMNQNQQKIVEKRSGSTANKKTCMPKKDNVTKSSKYDIELPQSIIDSFARFLVPEMRKYYESEQGRQEFKEWEAKRKEQEKKEDE